MKTEHNVKPGAVALEKNEPVMKIKGKDNKSISITVLPFFAMLTAIFPGIIFHASGTDIAKTGIVSLVLTGTVAFYIRANKELFLNKAFAKTIIILGYLISIALLLLVPEPELLNFWMIGGLVIAMLIDYKLGLMFNFNLVCILGIVTGINIGLMIQILILCILLSVLSGSLKSKSTVVYAAIIILSVNITLACAINNFIFEKVTDYNYFYSLFSILAVIVAAFFLSMLYQRKVKRQFEDDNIYNQNLTMRSDVNSEEKLPPQAVQGDSSETDSELNDKKDNKEDRILEIRTSYELLCDKDNLLLGRLKEFSESIYRHSIHIGELSAKAAGKIGADEMLARAGGYFHEIGKINGKNYMEEGVAFAKEYAFPDELTSIIKEHNIKYDKPNSVEAAIVMLSDNVVSTIEYIEKSDEHRFTSNKIIENIFQMRLEKGTLDSSGISLKNYKILKEFYQEEFRNTKKE